jgi:hypothetical protein
LLVQITSAGQTIINAASSTVVLTGYKLGSSYGYTPSASQTALVGSTVYSGVPNDPIAVPPNNIRYTVLLPESVGTFQFGEIGLYYNTTLFAICVFDQPQTKLPLDEATDTGGAFQADIYLPVGGGNYEMWVTLAQQNVLTVPVQATPDALPSSVNAVPNINILQTSYGTFLAYTDRVGLWNFEGFAVANSATIVSATSSSITLAVGSSVSTSTPLLQITSGTEFSASRSISGIATNGSGQQVISVAVPFPVVPSAGDTVNFYVQTTAPVNITAGGSF